VLFRSRYKIGSIPSGVLRRLHLPNFKFNPVKDYFIGSQWIGLSKKKCEMLLIERSLLRTELRLSFCPDEIAIKTFLGRKFSNKSCVAIKNKNEFDSVIDADFHLIHPSLAHNWQIDELNLILKSSKFFIRKPSLELLDYIRNHLI
jgi:hypothetical protein